MFSGLLGIAGSILSGGATGLLGVVLQRFFDYKKQQTDLAVLQEQGRQALALKQADAEIAKQEWAARTQVAQVEGDAKVAVAQQEGFAASFKLEPARYSEGAAYTHGQAWLLVALDLVRGLVRPGLTVYLCWITTQVYWESEQLTAKLGVLPDPANVLQLLLLIVETILYLTTTCVLWWFGTRNAQQPPRTRSAPPAPLAKLG